MRGASLLTGHPTLCRPRLPAAPLLERAGITFKGKKLSSSGAATSWQADGPAAAPPPLHGDDHAQPHGRPAGRLPPRRHPLPGMGRPEMVKADWVKPGAIVVDFGTTYTDERAEGRLRSGWRG
jgi:hypothetical protein